MGADILLRKNQPVRNDIVLRAPYVNLSAQYPILLLPVRLETKFYWTPDPKELRIRVYPDEIVADVHEPLLTSAEQAAGERYWTDGWPNVSTEQLAWRELVKHRSSERAAWIVRVTTPTNLASRPVGSPTFPTLTNRTSQWTKAAQSGILPDRFTVIAYRGGMEVSRVVGTPLPPSLTLGFRPDATQAELVVLDGLKVDPALRWTVDFAEAERIGMALRLPLTQADHDQGFDRLVVVGLKTSVSPAEAAERLAMTLDAHHYTRGLAFVHQGTPTNNADTARSGYPPPNDPDRSFGIERSGALPAGGSDGANLAAALGVSATSVGHVEGVFDHVEGTTGQEAKNAAWMNQALWPCTLGYFLDQMMHPLLSQAQIAEVRTHFETHVKARGPLPAFRISGVPYGVLPATAVGSWVPDTGASAVDVKLPQLLNIWRSLWLAKAIYAPHTGRNPSEPDKDLLEILGLDASAREVRVREILGPGTTDAMFRLVGLDPDLGKSDRYGSVGNVLAAAGMNGLHPRLEGMTFADEALRFGYPLVTTAPISETLPLTAPVNYISDLADWDDKGSINMIWDAVLLEVPPPVPNPRLYPLLYHLLRQAALVEYNRVGTALAIANLDAKPVDSREVELFQIPDDFPQENPPIVSLTRKTCWERFDLGYGFTSGVPLKTWLLDKNSTTPDRATVRAFRAALLALRNLSTAELERLTTETLDACSHRLDAWITSIATKRLGEIRAVQPTGIHLGGYGFVLNLRPKTPANTTAGGFIHAPSMAHAATAAVLRNAHITQTGALRDQVTIDLSSARVRKALHLLEGVEQGQPLGALLGYRFERMLHDAVLDLDLYIEPFRRVYPMGADPTTQAVEPTEQAPGRTVVDGLALRTAGVAGIPWGTKGLPVSSPPSAAYTAILPLLAALEDDVDAAADLLTAESVHQAIQGNPDRTGGTLAALAGGATIPRPRVIETPRSGTTFTHRVGVVLGEVPVDLGGWPAGSRPRRDAEPRLDAWVGRLLGDPASTVCQASYFDPIYGDRSRGPLDRRPPSPRGSASSRRRITTVTLADLGLVPLEVLEIARRSGAEANPEVLARVEWHLRQVLTSDPEDLTVDFAPAIVDPASGRTFRDVLETARTIAELLADARALAPLDLLRPGSSEDLAPPPLGDRSRGPWDRRPPSPRTNTAALVLATDLPNRAAGAITNLDLVINALGDQADAVRYASPPVGLDALRAALFAACAFGVPAALPANLEGTDAAARDALVAQADVIVDELKSRRDDAAAASLAGVYEDVIAAVFGPTFKVLPLCAPSNQAEIGRAFAADPVLTGASRVERQRWFHRLGRVRPALTRLRLVAMSTEAIGLGASPFELEVAQLPHANTPDRWIALPFLPGARPPSGALSFVAQRALDLSDPGAPLAGLVIDDWSELVPADTQKTAFAVHYDNPGAEAPQVALLAVPPVLTATWDQPMLLAILHETIDLAQIRAVDADVLGQSLLAPTIYCAGNVNNATVSDDLGTLLMAENQTVPPE